MNKIQIVNDNLKGLSQRKFALTGIDEGHHRINYRGVKCVKCPFDYVLYQMIINELKPDLIIEIGTNFGGSALYLADLLELTGKGMVHTIDINDNSPEIVKNHPRIELFFSGWENYDLELTRGFGKILVIEDSSHEYQNTLDAILKFSQVVTIGSYLIVEDGIIEDLGLSNKFKGGPVKAIEKFLEVNFQFEIDYSLINFFGPSATFNNLGYLKKKDNGI